MIVTATELDGVLILEPQVFRDSRGEFFEAYNSARFAEATGAPRTFVQDNHSISRQHVLRGLHYQVTRPQGKIVRVAAGTIFDVSVDLRRSSKTFGRWAGVVLSGESHRQVWIPEGFAHGFLVPSESAEVIYKTTDYYAPEFERTIQWDDPALAIEWPLVAPAILSRKDAAGTPFGKAELFD